MISTIYCTSEKWVKLWKPGFQTWKCSVWSRLSSHCKMVKKHLRGNKAMFNSVQKFWFYRLLTVLHSFTCLRLFVAHVESTFCSGPVPDVSGVWWPFCACHCNPDQRSCGKPKNKTFSILPYVVGTNHSQTVTSLCLCTNHSRFGSN